MLYVSKVNQINICCKIIVSWFKANKRLIDIYLLYAFGDAKINVVSNNVRGIG